MTRKIIFIGFIIFILFLAGCQQKPTEQKQSGFHIEAEANAVYTQHEKDCNALGEQIIEECMNINPKCFELKQQWDNEKC